MNVEEYYNQMQGRMKPVRHECSNCVDMPSCWLHNADFALDAVKECWKPRPVPSYIKNLEVK